MEYELIDRGIFDFWVLRDGVEIAFSDYDELRLTAEYRESDGKAILEIAEEYDLEIRR